LVDFFGEAEAAVLLVFGRDVGASRAPGRLLPEVPFSSSESVRQAVLAFLFPKFRDSRSVSTRGVDGISVAGTDGTRGSIGPKEGGAIKSDSRIVRWRSSDGASVPGSDSTSVVDVEGTCSLSTLASEARFKKANKGLSGSLD
jgi:hypothetical protein